MMLYKLNIAHFSIGTVIQTQTLTYFEVDNFAVARFVRI